MPYIPRAITVVNCAHCGAPFESRNLRRKYCSNSCNVLASYARTGQRAKRPTKADLEQTVVEMRKLLDQLKRTQLKEQVRGLKDKLEEMDTSTTSKTPRKGVKRP